MKKNTIIILIIVLIALIGLAVVVTNQPQGTLPTSEPMDTMDDNAALPPQGGGAAGTVLEGTDSYFEDTPDTPTAPSEGGDSAMNDNMEDELSPEDAEAVFTDLEAYISSEASADTDPDSDFADPELSN